MKIVSTVKARLAASALGLMIVASGPAAATETINLTFVSGFAPAGTFVAAFVEGFAPAVDEELAKAGNYKINWNFAHSGQIAKPRGELEAIESGLGDIGTIPTGLHDDKLPFHKLTFVTPFTTQDPDLVARVTTELQERFPEVNSTWASFNQRPIANTIIVDYYMLVSKLPLTKIADLNGKKVAGAGANLRWFDGTGATGVPSTLDNWYNGLQLGTYDAILAWSQVAGSFKLCEPGPYMLDGGFGSAGVHTLTVNNDVWTRLPDEVKDAMTKHGETWHKTQTALLLEGSASAMEFCKQSHNLVVSKLSDDDRKAWADALPPLGLEWAKGLEAAGLPGNAYLKAYMDRMRAAGQLVYRNWDVE